MRGNASDFDLFFFEFVEVAHESLESSACKASRISGDELRQIPADVEAKRIGRIKIDVCPHCHGMWLDNGEIEMLSRVQDSKAGTFIRDLFKGRRTK